MKPDERAAAGARRAPQGGWGNAEPPAGQRRTFTADDLAAFARHNAGVARARLAYAEHSARTENDRTCRNWCGTKTGRASGLCRDCEEGAV